MTESKTIEEEYEYWKVVKELKVGIPDLTVKDYDHSDMGKILVAPSVNPLVDEFFTRSYCGCLNVCFYKTFGKLKVHAQPVQIPVGCDKRLNTYNDYEWVSYDDGTGNNREWWEENEGWKQKATSMGISPQTIHQFEVKTLDKYYRNTKVD